MSCFGKKSAAKPPEKKDEAPEKPESPVKSPAEDAGKEAEQPAEAEAPQDPEEEGAPGAPQDVEEEAPADLEEEAPQDLETLRREVSELKREREELQQKVEEAERKAAELEDQLRRLPSQTRQQLQQTPSGLTERPSELQQASGSPRALSSSEGPPGGAPQQEDSGETARPASLSQSGPPGPRAFRGQPSARSRGGPPKEAEAAASRSPTAARSPQDATSEKDALWGPRDTPQETREGTTDAAAASKEDGEATEEPPEPRAVRSLLSDEDRNAERQPREPPEKADTKSLTGVVAISKPPSKESSFQRLRKRLSRTLSPKEERAAPKLSSGLGRTLRSQNSCVKCEALAEERAALRAELKAAQARCEQLNLEILQVTEKKRLLIEKVRQVVQRASLRVDQLQRKYELAMKEVVDDHLKAERARLFYQGRRKGLEMRVAALVDKVFEMEKAAPTLSWPTRRARVPAESFVFPRGAEEAAEEHTRRDTQLIPPYVFVELPESPDVSGDEQPSRRRTVLVPLHLFDEEAMQKAAQRSEAAATRRPTIALPRYVFDEDAMLKSQKRADTDGRRQTVAVPAYLFDEAAAEKARQRKVAAASPRRPTTVLPAHVFDEEALRKAQARAENTERRPTMPVPAYLFKEPKEENRRPSTFNLPADLFAEGQQEPSAPHTSPPAQETSRQSSFFPYSLFSSLSRQSRDQEQKQGSDASGPASQGPSVHDSQHESRRVSPVEVPESESEEAAESPEPPQGTRVRPLSQPSSRQSSSSSQSGSPSDATAKELEQAAPTKQGAGARGGKTPVQNAESFITAPCCGRSTVKSDIRPFRRCGCLICRQCLRTASMQSKVHINNFVGSDPSTGSPIWKVRCPTCGNVAPLTATQLRTASIKRSVP